MRIVAKKSVCTRQRIGVEKHSGTEQRHDFAERAAKNERQRGLKNCKL